MTTTDLVPYVPAGESQGERATDGSERGDRRGGDHWAGTDGKLARRKVVATCTRERIAAVVR